MEFLKRTWYIWVLLGIGIYLLSRYGFLTFTGINGSKCYVNPGTGGAASYPGFYKNGVCK